MRIKASYLTAAGLLVGLCAVSAVVPSLSPLAGSRRVAATTASASIHTFAVTNRELQLTAVLRYSVVRAGAGTQYNTEVTFTNHGRVRVAKPAVSVAAGGDLLGSVSGDSLEHGTSSRGLTRTFDQPVSPRVLTLREPTG